MRSISLKKIFSLLVMAGMLALAPALFSSAAAKSTAKPGFVEDVEAKDVAGTSATLMWTKASNATGYNIYRVNPNTSDIIKLEKQTTGLSCTLTITPGKLYCYQVFAYRKKGKKVIENQEGSPLVEVESDVLRFVTYGNGCAFLEWDAIPNVLGYILYKYDKKTGKYIKVEQFNDPKTTNCRVDVSVDETYYFSLRSYSQKKVKSGKKVKLKTVFSDYSNELAVKGKKLETVHGRRWKAYLKTDQKVKDSSGATIVLKKGTEVLTSANKFYDVDLISLADGKKYLIPGKTLNLKYTGLYLAQSYDLYDQKQSEDFINSKGYSSKTPYLIWVSQYTASVHIFKGYKGHWVQQRLVRCIIGKDGHTKPGEYEILATPRNSGHVYFYWNPVKQWGQSFHTWVDSHRWGAYSWGCVRMDWTNFKYVRSLPAGTKVVSY